jgi:hypothetical protein
VKLYTVTFFEHDGDGIVESNFYGVFDSYDLAYEALKQVIIKDGNDLAELYVCPPQYLYGAILRLSPKYGEYTIQEVELNKVYLAGWPNDKLMEAK